jgi:hypothetical protein
VALGLGLLKLSVGLAETSGVAGITLVLLSVGDGVVMIVVVPVVLD